MEKLTTKSSSKLRILHAWAVLFVLAVTNQPTYAVDPPDIIAGPFVTAKVGATLRLICHGEEPVNWNITHILDSDGRLTFTRTERNSSKPFSNTLTLVNVTYNDVGFFYCRYNTTEEDEANSPSTYLYVDDEEMPLVPVSEEFLIFATAGEKVLVPCRPTSLLVEIEIEKDNHPIGLDSKYDPRYGYLIDPVLPISAGYYTCVGRIQGEIKGMHPFYVQVIYRADTDASNTLRRPTITGANNGIVTLGSTFSVECISEQESYVLYALNWTQPANVFSSGRAVFESGWVDNKPPVSGSTEKKYFSRVTISDARKEDAGEYICTVSRTPSQTKSASTIIRVYEDKDRFLNVTTSSKDIKVKRGEDAQWAININTYPMDFDFTWTDHNGNEVANHNKFIIDETKKPIVVLRIKSATLDEAALYHFTVENLQFRELVQQLNLTLTVLDKPEVVIEPREAEQFYQVGQTYALSCVAHGYPQPRVQWYYDETEAFDHEPSLNCSSLSRMMKPYNWMNTMQELPKQTISKVQFTPTAHGVFRCRAENSEGVDCLHKYIKLIDFPNKDGFGIMYQEEVVEEDFVSLTCALSKLNGTKSLEWYRTSMIGGMAPLENEPGFEINNVETKWSRRAILNIPKVSMEHSGDYACLVGGVNKSVVHIRVKAMISPKIAYTNLNETAVTLREGEPPELKLYCNATGTPRPTIHWTKDGQNFSDWPEDINYNVSEDGEVLTFHYIRTAASGRYECTARNRNGTAKTYLSIEVEGNNGFHPALIGALIIVLIALMILGACLVKKKYKEVVMQRYLQEVRKRDFLEGAVGDINPQLGIEDQANLLPYDRKWEFPRNRLQLGMQLGSGAFGRVMKADAFGIIPGETCTTVAVKMVKQNADESHIKALMSELKIMVHLGQHVNVVNLLGACTEYLIKKKELFVIVEYCKYGSLLSYMHRHRHTFVNQLDPVKGIIDPGIYNSVHRTSQQSPAPKLNYAALTFTDTGNNRKTASNGYRTLEELTEEPSTSSSSVQLPGFENNFVNNLHPPSLHPYDAGGRSSSADYYGHGSNVGSMCTDMSYISNSPTACGYDEGKRRSSGASTCLDHYRGDYQQLDVRPIKTTDLLCWAFQISRGMEYLASRKVLHGDLAARNVLLAVNNVVKICDFGLAKEMYKDYKYKKKSEGVLLPVKWMAIESIYYGVFSTQSDVWSFAVVLWELFTLGKTPYPGMEADDRFYKMLNEGYRMEKPPLAPSSMYDLMLECWAHEPSERPPFSALVDRIGDMMEEGLRQHYLDLNVSYDKMNREWLSQKQDYLSTMGVPDFQSESCRPTPERQYENVPQTMDSGYLLPITRSAGTGDFNPVKYQNLSNQNEPLGGALLANNTGYMLMNHPSPTEEGANLSANIFEETTNLENSVANSRNTQSSSNPFLQTNAEIKISQSDLRNPTEKAEDENADDSFQPYSLENVPNFEDKPPNRESSPIKNSNYIPNNLVFTQGKTRDLNEVVEEIEKQKLEKSQNGSGIKNKSEAHEVDPRHLLGGVKRQKNDSGLGSIDSSHFEGNRRSPTDLMHRGSSSGSETDPNNSGSQRSSHEGPMIYQHNLSYVSHTPFDLSKGDEARGGPSAIGLSNTHSHSSLVSAGGSVA